MVSRRRVLSIAMLVAIASSCKDDKRDAAGSQNAQTKSGPLEPSDPVDPAFQGCSKSCGSRSAKDRAEAKMQPNVALGDATYCPVSGAIFRITSQTLEREARGKTLYFCCESCAAFFTSHEADVLSRRGLG